MSEESIITPTPESPMPAETTALDVLQRQVESLTAQISTLTSERDEYRDAVTDLAAERDSLKTAPEASARIAELEASIRDRNHFDKFAELAKGAKAKDKALKQLWREPRTAATSPSPTRSTRRHSRPPWRSSRPRSTTRSTPSPTPPPRPPRRLPSPETSRTKYGLDIGSAAEPAGGGRASRNQGADGTIVTQEMRADPKFMLDPKNQELIRDAALGGRFR